MIDNVFTADELTEIINHFRGQPVSQRFEPAETDNKNLDYELEDSLVYRMIRPKISNLLGDDEHVFFAGAYKEYKVPYQLHIDNTVPTASMVFESTKKHKTAFLIPLMEGEDLKTALFDVFLPVGHAFKVGAIMEDRVAELKPFLLNEKTELIVDEFDHIFDPLNEMLPYIPVDTIHSWKLGSVITWHFDQLHCSSNFKKNDITKKFIIIMIN
jgi:hypothetical protein